jgi:hypothetical protein
MPNAGWNNLKRTAGPGRPKGRQNNATLEAKAVCTHLVDDPIYRERLKARLVAGKLPPAVETMLWYYAKGKPKDVLEVEDRGQKLIRIVLAPKPTPEDTRTATAEPRQLPGESS